MDTPICDFVQNYINSDTLRVHMPGHKGVDLLGFERRDLTEIDGADSLYAAEGIIRKSEENASALFGCPTFYSTEGSSHGIRAMLYLMLLYAKQTGRKPLIAAGRNVHKTFLDAAALLDLDVLWLFPQDMDSYLSCNITATELEVVLCAATEKPVAVYLTNPDYLGNLTDMAEIAAVCHKYGVLLLVDNAHGAYLRFLTPSQHPMDLGADICCDSAHKTLPVITGGAYLHLSSSLPPMFMAQAKAALSLFGSTSPSYLILQSLDAVNPYLCDHPQRLGDFVKEVEALKGVLTAYGYKLYGQEPLKITLHTKPFGYTGIEMAALLRERNVVCEFYDPDYLVMMVTPETGREGLKRLETALLSIPQKAPVTAKPPRFRQTERVCSVREAMLSPAERVEASACDGRVLAAATVGCPPAVPILACGERIDAHTIACFQYYGITQCLVLAE